MAPGVLPPPGQRRLLLSLDEHLFPGAGDDHAGAASCGGPPTKIYETPSEHSPHRPSNDSRLTRQALRHHNRYQGGNASQQGGQQAGGGKTGGKSTWGEQHQPRQHKKGSSGGNNYGRVGGGGGGGFPASRYASFPNKSGGYKNRPAVQHEVVRGRGGGAPQQHEPRPAPAPQQELLPSSVNMNMMAPAVPQVPGHQFLLGKSGTDLLFPGAGGPNNPSRPEQLPAPRISTPGTAAAPTHNKPSPTTAAVMGTQVSVTPSSQQESNGNPQGGGWIDPPRRDVVGGPRPSWADQSIQEEEIERAAAAASGPSRGPPPSHGDHDELMKTPPQHLNKLRGPGPLPFNLDSASSRTTKTPPDFCSSPLLERGGKFSATSPLLERVYKQNPELRTLITKIQVGDPTVRDTFQLYLLSISSSVVENSTSSHSSPGTPKKFTLVPVLELLLQVCGSVRQIKLAEYFYQEGRRWLLSGGSPGGKKTPLRTKTPDSTTGALMRGALNMSSSLSTSRPDDKAQLSLRLSLVRCYAVCGLYRKALTLFCDDSVTSSSSSLGSSSEDPWRSSTDFSDAVNAVLERSTSTACDTIDAPVNQAPTTIDTGAILGCVLRCCCELNDFGNAETLFWLGKRHLATADVVLLVRGVARRNVNRARQLIQVYVVDIMFFSSISIVCPARPRGLLSMKIFIERRSHGRAGHVSRSRTT